MILLILTFSIFAAGMAFVITFQEYARHIADRKRVFRKALGASLVTLLFFLIVPWLLIRLLPAPSVF